MNTPGALGQGLRAALLAVLGVGVVLRIPGMFTDFWLDEIWTLVIAELAGAPLDIFTLFPDSNNQHLNTLFFYFIGHRDFWPLYRVHSLLAGVALIVLVWCYARRHGATESLCVALMTAVSYPLIHFSSEGRGYALALTASVCALICAAEFAENRRTRWAVGFWVAAGAGFLSHLTFLHTFNAIAAWLAVRVYRDERRVGHVVWPWLRCVGLPLAALIIFYLLVLRHFVVSGGPDMALDAVLIEMLSYSFGGAATGPSAWLASAVITVLSVLAIAGLWRAGRSEWVFFVVVILASPLLIHVVLRPPVVVPRHFLINAFFAMLVCGLLLGRWLHHGGRARWAAGVLIGLYIVGNGLNVARFLAHGRGAYLDGVQYMAAHTAGDEIVVTSDHDFRNRMTLVFYRRYLPAGKQLRYVQAARAASVAPEWRLHLRGAHGPVPEHPYVDTAGTVYELKIVTPYYGMSGFEWYIYRKR